MEFPEEHSENQSDARSRRRSRRYLVSMHANTRSTVDSALIPADSNISTRIEHVNIEQPPAEEPLIITEAHSLIDPLILLNQVVANSQNQIENPVIDITEDSTENSGDVNEVRIVPLVEAEPQSGNNAPGSEVTVNADNTQPTSNNKTEPSTPPNSGKKRKRSNSKSPKDDDDGSICPICLEHWEMSGPHRLTSLKCGHLFGDSCIRRWLVESPSGIKCCPTCKTKAMNRDLRYIYAKRVRAVDNTEEIRLKELLETNNKKFIKLQADRDVMVTELKTVKSQVIQLQNDLEIMRRISNNSNASGDISNIEKYKKYQFDHKMFMLKNIEISKEAGCRVLIYSKVSKNLLVSQKSSQTLFPGYGLKYIDVNNNFRPTTFLHTSLKTLRDLTLNVTEDNVVCASMEKSAKMYDINNGTIISTFTPSDKCIWSCAMDQEKRCNLLYLGSQHGSTYIYDIRNPSTIVEETSVCDDLSPVINISAIKISNDFPFGGFLVCKLQSLWFYEFLSDQKTNATRLAVDGPFMSMNYDRENGNILISTKPSNTFPMSKYILGKIIKLNDIITLDIEMSLFGSKITQVMSRCTQVPVKDNSLVAAYIQDAKQLTLWNVGESTKIQSLHCIDTVFDTCPVVSTDKIFVAALTGMKCRIYEVISTPKF